MKGAFVKILKLELYFAYELSLSDVADAKKKLFEETP